MAGFNGSGTFVRTHDWTTDLSNTVPVTASRMDAEDDGFATGLSNTICRDGQSTTTARIPFAAGLSAAAGTTASVSYAQTNDNNTGLYFPGSDQWGLVAGGTAVLTGTATALTATGTLGLSGDFAINTNKFTVTAASGNTLVAGTLAVTGAATLSSTLAAGATTITGALAASGDFAIATNKFTVASASGNTAVAGTLGVTGATTLSSTLAAGATTITGGMTASGAVSGATAAGSMIATQAEQETGSATDKLVTPGRQHFHASAIKFWLHATVSAGSPTLQTSYNVTSISDVGSGLLGVTIANDFSGTSWCCHVTCESTAAQFRHGDVANGTIAAGSVTGTCSDGPGGIVDPTSWHISGMGDL